MYVCSTASTYTRARAYGRAVVTLLLRMHICAHAETRDASPRKNCQVAVSRSARRRVKSFRPPERTEKLVFVASRRLDGKRVPRRCSRAFSLTEEHRRRMNGSGDLLSRNRLAFARHDKEQTLHLPIGEISPWRRHAAFTDGAHSLCIFYKTRRISRVLVCDIRVLHKASRNLGLESALPCWIETLRTNFRDAFILNDQILYRS